MIGGVEFVSRSNGEALGISVGSAPGRKAQAVMVRRGGVIYTVAYCRNDKEAARLRVALAELLSVRYEEGQCS